MQYSVVSAEESDIPSSAWIDRFSKQIGTDGSFDRLRKAAVKVFCVTPEHAQQNLHQILYRYGFRASAEKKAREEARREKPSGKTAKSNTKRQRTRISDHERKVKLISKATDELMNLLRGNPPQSADLALEFLFSSAIDDTFQHLLLFSELTKRVGQTYRRPRGKNRDESIVVELTILMHAATESYRDEQVEAVIDAAYRAFGVEPEHKAEHRKPGDRIRVIRGAFKRNEPEAFQEILRTYGYTVPPVPKRVPSEAVKKLARAFKTGTPFPDSSEDARVTEEDEPDIR